MIQQNLSVDYDSSLHISDVSLIDRLENSALVGNWFAFLKPDWLQRSSFEPLLTASGITTTSIKPVILFRGKDELMLPGATISPRPLPAAQLISLTSDKALYRANRDTVRLLIAAPLQPGTALTLHLRVSGNAYADFPLTLDQYGLCLWSLQGLPEGEYRATLESIEAVDCRFEVAEYRLSPLNAELVAQQLSGSALHYTLAISAFGQPYTGQVEVEVQERGQRVGKRALLNCNRQGQCRSVARLTGAGPYTLNIFAGERSATIALKGSEQERREPLVISELGEVREISLLPQPQSNNWRGVYITRGASNNEPFVMQRVVGSEAEITPRAPVEMLKAVIVDAARATSEELVFENLPAGQPLRLPVPAPYGVILLGAFIDGHAWEGWCSVLRPSELQLQFEAPKEARPGARITVELKTAITDRPVPVQLIVRDARLIAPGDPQVELAARIKKHLTVWREQSKTGTVERKLADYRQQYHPPFPTMLRAMAMQVPPQPFMATTSAPVVRQPTTTVGAGFAPAHPPVPTGAMQPEISPTPTTPTTPQASLAKIRLSFAEIIFNEIVMVQGETEVELKLGDSITRYSVEAFALDPRALDWQRATTEINAVQPVYGELSVSPFVFPGDPVTGSLYVGAASGGAIAEVRHDNEILPLFHEDGSEVTPGLPIPSHSLVRFPLRPGVITATVRDARKGGVDVSERYVTEPGKLRHIARRLRLLTPGEAVSSSEARVLELKPMPGLERPFQVFVAGAVKYPFGCIEQTSSMLLAMFVGYITNLQHVEVARDYEAAILVWHKRLRSMELAGGGFCMYPPEEGQTGTVDTHYAPRGIKHLLNLPTIEHSGIKEAAMLDILRDIAALAKKGAAYYKIALIPRAINDCHDAYQIMMRSDSQQERDKAAAYAREKLKERADQTFVAVPEGTSSYNLYGQAVAQRQETAYAAATLLAAGQAADLPAAIAATNYLTGQLNEEGRLYSTVDTAACLALLLALRASGVVDTAGGGMIEVNGQPMKLAEVLAYNEKVESIRCIEGVIAVQVTSEVIEDWSMLKSVLPVEVRLERAGRVQKNFKVGDALDLVISVPRYEPGMIAHVCLPDALARIAGGGQVKRFSLDFCEKRVLRVPLAATSATSLAGMQRFGMTRNKNAQHWAVVVRNMFKEEQVGNPGLLEVVVE
ncbi:MAG TPA: hypothetical protein VNE38_04965 [Ktedonobacteraceae bacterium]|nr:hypothetical protein [Ktedonobacteraceae bacterium]